MSNAWRNFKTGVWCDEINVRDFINKNYTAYDGDASFLEAPTERTQRVSKRRRAGCGHKQGGYHSFT